MPEFSYLTHWTLREILEQTAPGDARSEKTSERYQSRANTALKEHLQDIQPLNWKHALTWDDTPVEARDTAAENHCLLRHGWAVSILISGCGVTSLTPDLPYQGDFLSSRGGRAQSNGTEHVLSRRELQAVSESDLFDMRDEFLLTLRTIHARCTR